MATCNLFNPISDNTGNFLLFAQYANDLTKSATHTDPYRVIPSKFVVLNLDYSDFDDKSITKLIQNYYENACAYFKNNEFKYSIIETAPYGEWTPEVSKNLFWRCLKENNLITKQEISVGDRSYNYCPEMLYCGDINIQTNNIYNGDGFNEIYCYIPNSNNCSYIGCEFREDSDTDAKYTYDSEYVIGYENNEELGDIVKLEPPITYNANAVAQFSFDGNSLNTDPNPLTKYEFNTVILLYDIYVKNEEDTDWVPEYQNIPMGIHFCGHISEGKITNPITIFVSNADIYDQGTSYGLKVCMRYTATSDSNISHIDITSENDSIFPGFCIVMSEMSKTLDKMNDVITGVYANSQISKELLAIFKNERVNVPYIKWVGKEPNKEPYWFINGRNTGVVATRTADITNYDNETEVKPELERLEEIIHPTTDTLINK